MPVVDETERRACSGALRGRHARAALAPLVRPARPRLTLDLGDVRQVDAYGGAVLRAAIDRHLQRHRRGTVQLVEPSDEEVSSLARALLDDLPPRCRWLGEPRGSSTDPCVVLPATAVRDRATATLITDRRLRRPAAELRVSARERHALQEAAATFIDNARLHARRAPTPVVLCAMLEPQGNDLQLVAVDLGQSLVRSPHAAAALRQMIAGGRREQRGLYWLATAPRGGLTVSVRISAGTGRARWRSGQSWHFRSGPEVPGFVAGFEVHR